jgi:hypothetical protein
VLTGTFEIPPNAHLMPGDTLGVNNDDIGVRIIDGTVTEELNPGDIIRLNENNQWVKVINPIDSLNFNPNIPATPALESTEPEAISDNEMLFWGGNRRIRSRTIPPSSTDTGTITFEDMVLTSVNTTLNSEGTTTHLEFIGPNGSSVSMDVIPQSDLDSLINHTRSCTIEISLPRGVLIGGVRYEVVGSIDIRRNGRRI